MSYIHLLGFHDNVPWYSVFFFKEVMHLQYSKADSLQTTVTRQLNTLGSLVLNILPQVTQHLNLYRLPTTKDINIHIYYASLRRGSFQAETLMLLLRKYLEQTSLAQEICKISHRTQPSIYYPKILMISRNHR